MRQKTMAPAETLLPLLPYQPNETRIKNAVSTSANVLAGRVDSFSMSNDRLWGPDRIVYISALLTNFGVSKLPASCRAQCPSNRSPLVAVSLTARNEFPNDEVECGRLGGETGVICGAF